MRNDRGYRIPIWERLRGKNLALERCLLSFKVSVYLGSTLFLHTTHVTDQ